MNTYLILSGFLTALMSIVHSIVGELLILIPLQKAQGLPAVRGSVHATRSTLRFTWHITSVLGLGIAFIFFYFARLTELNSEQIVILRILSLTFLASFVVAIVGSRARHPSWMVFLIVSILTWLSTL